MNLTEISVFRRNMEPECESLTFVGFWAAHLICLPHLLLLQGFHFRACIVFIANPHLDVQITAARLTSHWWILKQIVGYANQNCNYLLSVHLDAISLLSQHLQGRLFPREKTVSNCHLVLKYFNVNIFQIQLLPLHVRSVR